MHGVSVICSTNSLQWKYILFNFIIYYYIQISVHGKYVDEQNK